MPATLLGLGYHPDRGRHPAAGHADLQQRRERENRQINERLRMLIAAYKVLGGSSPAPLRSTHASARLRARRRRGRRRMTPAPDSAAARAASATRWKRRCPTSSCWAPRSRCAWPRRRPRPGGRPPGAHRRTGGVAARLHPPGARPGTGAADVQDMPRQGPRGPRRRAAAGRAAAARAAARRGGKAGGGGVARRRWRWAGGQAPPLGRTPSRATADH